MLVNDLKLYFEFEVEVRACLPNTGGSVTSAYESPYYMTHSHVNSSSKDDLAYADKYQVNVSRQLRKNLRKLEELNYCKVKDYAFDYDGFVVELDVDLDINEHTLGAYGENAIVFFKREAMPILTQCDDYDTMRDSEGNIVTFTAIHLTLIPIEKEVKKMTLRTKLELHFRFELDIYYGHPGDKENAMIIHFKDNSQQLLDAGKSMYKNIVQEMNKNMRHLEDLGYCKVDDIDIEFDDWDITLTLDVDINEHELGAYGENGAIFFARKAIPYLATYPKYDSMTIDGVVMPYLACVRIYSVDK